jgi:ribose transport system substrate-binding protein
MRTQAKSTVRRRHLTLPGAVSALVAAVLAVAGCGSSSSSKSSSGPAGPGVAAAQAKVAQLEQPTTSFPPPGPPLKNVRSLAGRTVWYIPITQKVEFFQAVSGALKTALGKAGVHLRTCSGEANPSATAACVSQAVASQAGAIIVDAIPIVVAANAFASAQSAGIPILVTDQLPPPPGLPGVVRGIGTDKLAYAPLSTPQLLNGIADWIVADSKGHANVLVTELTDSPFTKVLIQQNALGEFRKYCPGCQTTISLGNIANPQLIPSATSSSLLSHPGVNYLLTEFDALVQLTHAGAQQAGFAQKVKGGSTTGLLSALQLIRSHNFLAADVGEDYPYGGWAVADEVMRMMLHAPPVTENVPIRLFTSANVGSLQLTPSAQASGAWYGGSGYTTMFTKLWGLSSPAGAAGRGQRRPPPRATY